MSPSIHKPLLLLACLCGLLAADRAWALKTDKSQPINIQSDHADFRSDPDNNSNGTGIYTGNVIITQGSIVLTADKAILRVINNELSTADVTGNPATFQQQPDQGEPMHGQALEITYDAGHNEILLINSAKLSQQVVPQAASQAAPQGVKDLGKGNSMPGERLMTADRIRYNTDTQRVVARAASDEERVHLSFPPRSLTPAAGTAVKPRRANPPGKAPHSFAPPPATASPAPAAGTEDGPP